MPGQFNLSGDFTYNETTSGFEIVYTDPNDGSTTTWRFGTGTALEHPTDVVLDTGETVVDHTNKEVPQSFLGGPAASLSGYPLPNGDLAQVDGERGLQPEGAQDGLVADATGVQYEGRMRQQLDSWLLSSERSVYLEAATASSAGDETVDVEVYDDTAAAVATSLSIAGGSPRTRSADISASLTAGNEVHVRWNVTTASATGGATFDAIGARLVVE